MRIKIRKQEFPYDVGILDNMRQGMGSIPLLWLWPFAATPSNDSGLNFETNGFEGTLCFELKYSTKMLLTDPLSSWPPLDPDRMPRSSNRPAFEQPFVYDEDSSTTQMNVKAFRKRQNEDIKRYNEGTTTSRRPFNERYSRNESFTFPSTGFDDPGSRKEGWRDSDGDRLDDFGVDEDAEHEDDVPLARLLRRRHENNDDI